MHILKRETFLNTSINEAWDFFSNPFNLKKITPEYMGFDILSDCSDEKMYAGMIISYIVKPVIGIPLKWVTEITHVNEPYFFVDEQRFGPYKFWHHQHKFIPVENGVKMIDIVNYKIPLGFFGNFLNSVFIREKVKEIFRYRSEVITRLFNK